MRSMHSENKRHYFHAAEGSQHGRRLLITFLDARTLAELWDKGLIKADKYSGTNPEGYQRELAPTRARNFAKFVRDIRRGISPNSILLYSRTESGGITKEGDTYYLDEELLLEEGKKIQQDTSLFVSDGQHRIAGVAHAIKQGWLEPNESYDFPVIIMFWDEKTSPYPSSKLEEASQFYTIQTEQKRMKTDLAHQLLFERFSKEHGSIVDSEPIPLSVKKMDYVPYAVHITRSINSVNGPLRGRIGTPGEISDRAIVSESSFSSSLYDMIKYGQNSGMTMSEIVEMINNYWKAISRLCHMAIVERPQDYHILKTPGIFSLHMLLPLLVMRGGLGKKPTEEQFYRLLKKFGDVFTDAFWYSRRSEGLQMQAASFGTGAKAFKQLTQYILEQGGL